ncbi:MULTISPECIES: hypothetical protein [unclassified Rhodococcus (in: high G+C Gram-positive bacteria)]|uniref:hypothetical protein n=1 Tax=unclassified Rhodococcus (in: high G+C Gram-positive bacteria) TaxID=192944 RepID=UPI001E28A415|nr:hypothetical protein [Rhodococcus sp. M8]
MTGQSVLIDGGMLFVRDPDDDPLTASRCAAPPDRLRRRTTTTGPTKGAREPQRA